MINKRDGLASGFFIVNLFLHLSQRKSLNENRNVIEIKISNRDQYFFLQYCLWYLDLLIMRNSISSFLADTVRVETDLKPEK